MDKMFRTVSPHFIFMRQLHTIIGIALFTLLITSCAAPSYLPSPEINYPYIKNTCNFGIQNMDEDAQIELKNLTCHYKEFDIKFKLTKDTIITFEIINKTNKSMIIDKSKCYVLRDGYATDLFKDVRSSRSTTFNNVQDAINNVQTNETSVSMTIPPYSKWTTAIKETNLKKLEKLPDFITEPGITHLTQYDDIDVVEFIIPYSFDYSMAKWSTCRNRVYINCITSEKVTIASRSKNKYLYDNKTYIDNDGNFYYTLRTDLSTAIDYTEANRIDDINIGRYKKHRRKVLASHICWSPIVFSAYIGTLPISVWFGDEIGDMYGCRHYPTIHGNKYVQKVGGKVKMTQHGYHE